MGVDLAQYHRRLKILSYFGSSLTPIRKPFQNASTWEPDTSKIPTPTLDLIKKDLQTLKTLKPIQNEPNLTDTEQKALLDLMENQNLVLKPADKGSALVIMDRADYIKEALRQLTDAKYYIPLNQSVKDDTAIEIAQILDTLLVKRHLSKKQVIYLKGQTPHRPRLFYILPKIHKPREKWNENIPPGRPIVSDCSSESYGVAEYLDSFLTPLSNRHPSYLKDTTDFIDKLGQITITEDFKLFTMDVGSLYTNIEISLGLAAVKKWFKKYPDPGRPEEELLKLLEINLTKNDFIFNDKIYLQIKGTAMGKKFAPAYANIYMADWEDTVFPKCKKKPLMYFRYLDDIFGIWTHSENDFTEFVQTLNKHHASIQLDPVLHDFEVHFLDVTVYKGRNFLDTRKLDTKVFFKPTDTHALLHKRSFHPQHVFKGIYKSQLIRFKRICSNPQDELDATRTLNKTLRQRGYQRSFLRKVQKQVNLKTPQKHKDNQEQTSKKDNLIPLVSLFSNYTVTANQLLKRNFLETLSETTLAQNCKIISAYKKNPNLKNLLVRAKLQPPKNKTTTNREKPVKNLKTKMGINLPRPLSLTLTNCVYLITCKKCPQKYVGQTSKSIHNRRTQYMDRFTNNLEPSTHLTRHFQDHGAGNFFIRGLEHDQTWTFPQRIKTKRGWIIRLGTMYPFGLNEEEETT